MPEIELSVAEEYVGCLSFLTVKHPEVGRVLVVAYKIVNVVCQDVLLGLDHDKVH